MASYVTRPNWMARPPNAPEYCRALATCTTPTTARPETIHRLIDRYNHNRGDWERRNQVAVTPATPYPVGAVAGDLFLPDGSWGIASSANLAQYLSVFATARQTGVGLWQANPAGTGFVRIR